MAETTVQAMPGAFPVSIIVGFRESRDQRWQRGEWVVTGLVAGGRSHTGDIGRTRLHAGAEDEQYLWSGLRVELHRDEAESYYYNLISDDPRVFIICTSSEGETIRPVHVTLSYDEAASYSEVDAMVKTTPMPGELYRWAERFVLEHYVPEKKKKRKRDNWKQADRRRTNER